MIWTSLLNGTSGSNWSPQLAQWLRYWQLFGLERFYQSCLRLVKSILVSTHLSEDCCSYVACSLGEVPSSFGLSDPIWRLAGAFLVSLLNLLRQRFRWGCCLNRRSIALLKGWSPLGFGFRRRQKLGSGVKPLKNSIENLLSRGFGASSQDDKFRWPDFLHFGEHLVFSRREDIFTS